jgi:hypothetical protein
VLSLPDTWERITFGRGMAATVVLAWDEEVSRTHAELLRIGDDWAPFAAADRTRTAIERPRELPE